MTRRDPASARTMQQIGAIQSLRAIAALMVVVHHLAHELSKLPGSEAAVALIRNAAPWMTGVDIFFVISGFIMVHASASLFGRPGAAGLFLKRRLIRIAPIYWLMTLLVAAIAFAAPAMVTDGAPEPAAVIASLLFWPYERPGGAVQPVLSLGWTLNYEMLFYALFAAALALGRGPRATVVATTGLLALLLVVGALAGGLPWTFWGRPIVLEFALGMAVGLAREAGWRLPKAMRLPLLAGGVGALVAAPAVADPSGLQAVLAHGLPALAMVSAAALGEEGRDLPRSPALERLGDASYALYLTHPLALKALAIGFHVVGPPWQLYPPLALACAVALAMLTWRIVERPATRLLRRRLGV